MNNGASVVVSEATGAGTPSCCPKPRAKLYSGTPRAPQASTRGQCSRRTARLSARRPDVYLDTLYSAFEMVEAGGTGRFRAQRALVRIGAPAVPLIESRYRVRKDPAGRIVLGKRAAAVAAVHAALTNPGVFGSCVAISYGRADTVRAQGIARRIPKLASRERGRPRFYVAWNRYEIRRPQSMTIGMNAPSPRNGPRK